MSLKRDHEGAAAMAAALYVPKCDKVLAWLETAETPKDIEDILRELIGGLKLLYEKFERGPDEPQA